MLPLPSGNNSSSVHLVPEDLDRFPLLAFALDALSNPEAYSNVSRSRGWVVIEMDQDSREIVRSFLVARFRAEYGAAPFPHNDHLLEIHYCGVTQSGQFCGFALFDFQKSP
jgi:hypothetical protein